MNFCMQKLIFWVSLVTTVSVSVYMVLTLPGMGSESQVPVMALLIPLTFLFGSSFTCADDDAKTVTD